MVFEPFYDRKTVSGKRLRKKSSIGIYRFFRKNYDADKIYISVSLENAVARKMYCDIGFREIKEIEYTFMGEHYREIQMVKQLLL